MLFERGRVPHPFRRKGWGPSRGWPQGGRFDEAALIPHPCLGQGWGTPREQESLTVYVNDQIVYYDNAEVTLATGQLTSSGAMFVGGVAGTTGRLSFVLWSDGTPGGELVIDNIRTFGLILGDFDLDGDVDLTDFVQFQLCFGGANNPPAPTCPPGVNADLDGDGDVDLADFLIFQQNFTGSM